MSKSTQVVTLRMPVELKSRLESEAHTQGVSMNSLANYMLTRNTISSWSPSIKQRDAFSKIESSGCA